MLLNSFASIRNAVSGIGSAVLLASLMGACATAQQVQDAPSYSEIS
jgi:hypothetical protein